MRILVLTTEPLPLPGLPTTGAGLRAWGLAFGLRAAGFEDVRLGFAADSIRGRELPAEGVPGVHAFERGNLGGFLEEHAPDAVVLQHWGLANALPALKCPLAVDLAGPHLLERQLWGSRDLAGDLREKLTALARADHVVCSGHFQRHYFLPFLFQAGFNPKENLCPVIPFSVSPDMPAPNPDRDTSRFLYAGFFLPWQDPSAMLGWTMDSLEKRERGTLVVAGGAHPGGDVSGGQYDALVERIGKHPRAERHGVAAFDEFLGLLLNSGVFLDLMPRNPERELAFPTRTVVAMWAGLPVIHNNFDELAEPIERTKAGWTLDPTDRDSFTRIVDRLAGHSEDVLRRGQNAQKLVRDNYTWDGTIGPLADWCRDPHKRQGKATVTVTMPAERERARSRRPRISYSPPPPVAGPNRLQQVLSPLALLLALPISLVLLVLFGFAELVRLLVPRRRV
ncbi:glycosyltransferase family 4 protein [Candidatus Poribacteria bacterium]|nr:glycosyltransferase family 4 protein [Candidatus Poribacteria bacterium]